jgi:hypothetical protein
MLITGVKMKHFIISILLFTGVAFSAPITTRSIFDVKNLPSERVEACANGCYVLTHAELIQGLRAAHEAGKRSTK